jgi:hypothetical protein
VRAVFSFFALTESLTELWSMMVRFDEVKNKKPSETLRLRGFDMFWLTFCDPAGIRTQDPYIKSVLLYQLSYGIFPQKFQICPF